MDKRRKYKDMDQREYSRLNKRIKQMCAEAKEKWLDK